MKTIKYLGLTLSLMLMFSACEQDVKELMDPCEADPSSCAPDTSCEDAEAGSANFTKFVAIGNSFVAGVQGGALFTDGQNQSLPLIINQQLKCVGGDETFKQPDIKATLGWNLFITQPKITSNPDAPVYGRMLLQYGTTPDCATGTVSPKPTPQPYVPASNIEALPNPSLNPNFVYGDGSTKGDLNNFGIPAILLGQSLITQTGNWAAPTDPRFNPFYGRLAVPGTGSTLIGDAAAAQGTFFLFWLGLDDFLLHAAFGADPAKAPLTPATGGLPNGFDGQYAAAVGSLLASNPDLKGVVGNFPNIFAMPHFQLVKYNPIPLDQATADLLNGANGFAGYNMILDGMIANTGLPQELRDELATRKVAYVAGCTNKMLLIDETLTDLGPYFDGMVGTLITAEQREKLVPYEQVRQSAPTDIIPLSTGSVLGTTVGGNPLMIMGVTVPLADQYVLIPSELVAIETARASYNQTVANIVAANPTRLALADVNGALNTLITKQLVYYNNVGITPTLPPPTGIYSEDGIHPNSRGYAFLANVFIDAINAKFGSTIPHANLANYGITGLPIPAN